MENNESWNIKTIIKFPPNGALHWSSLYRLTGVIYPSVKFWHWVLLKDCLWRGNKYSREEQAATRGFRWVRRMWSHCIQTSEHELIGKQVLRQKNAPSLLYEQVLVVITYFKAAAGGGVSCWYLLSTFTVDSDVSWTFIGMMYSMVKQRPDSSPAKEREVRVGLIWIYPRKHRTNRCAELFED